MANVARDGEPELIRGQQQGSLQRPNEHEVRTTPVPAGAEGYAWIQYFNSRFTGQKPIRGFHDGKNTITVECDDESTLNETIDAAIEYANEKVKKGSRWFSSPSAAPWLTEG